MKCMHHGYNSYAKQDSQHLHQYRLLTSYVPMVVQVFVAFVLHILQ